MKRHKLLNLTALTMLVLLASLSSFAKDKEKTGDKPVPSPEKRLTYVLAQRDFSNSVVQAQPYEINVQQMRGKLQQAEKEITKDVDLTKWKWNANTAEFDEVKPPVEKLPTDKRLPHATPAPADKPPTDEPQPPATPASAMPAPSHVPF